MAAAGAQGTASDAEVLVVGAGPTGLSLAAQLAAYGIRCRIVDRSLDRARESRALAIQPRTLEVLAPLGVTGEMIACGNRAVRLRMHVGRRTVPIRLFDIGVNDTAHPYLLFLSQAETERILGAHLASRGVQVERGVQLVRLKQAGGLAVASLRHQDGREESVRARYVVGCDGAHSTVRQQAGIAFEGSAYRDRAGGGPRLPRRPGDAVLLPAGPAGDVADAGHATARGRHGARGSGHPRRRAGAHRRLHPNPGPAA
jgi:2-polyprenyl-6-methoxyphenol hydroxylase-like FAD-dependent oxidoreductase